MTRCAAFVGCLVIAIAVWLVWDYGDGASGQGPKPEKRQPVPLPELIELAKDPTPFDINFQGKAEAFEKALVAFCQAFRQRNPALAERILIEFYDKTASLNGMWLHMVLRFVPPEVERNWHDSLVELLVSDTSGPPEFSKWTICSCVDPEGQQALREIQVNMCGRYLQRLNEKNRLPSENFFDLLFRVDRECALWTLLKGSKEYQALPAPRQEQLSGELEWFTHVMEVLRQRTELGRLQPGDCKLAQEQMKWLLSTFPHWYAKRYVLETLVNFPQLADQELLSYLREEQHPYVIKHLEKLEQKLKKNPQ